MKKGILILYMSLRALFCSSQASSDPVDVPVIPPVQVPDTSSIISDLISTASTNSKVILNWRKGKYSKLDFITIERSSGGNNFEVVAVLKQPQGDTAQSEWIDEAPTKGRNLYRVRYTAQDGRLYYSNTSSALIIGDSSYRFYPNPVDNVLIVRSDSSIDMQIIDGNGKVRVSQNGIQGLQTINVASLEKGLYLIRINNRATSTISQEKLLKN